MLNTIVTNNIKFANLKIYHTALGTDTVAASGGIRAEKDAALQTACLSCCAILLLHYM